MKPKTLNLVADDIGVDSGMIIIADIGYLDITEKTKKRLSLGKVFDVPNGTYRFNYSIPHTWNGPVKGDTTLTITNGKLVVIDPCYVIQIGKKSQKDWLAWLDKTEYGKNLKDSRAYIIDSMGGDGCYKVKLTLKKV